ncbi:primosomal protein N' [Methylophaga sp. 41_12_T18]|nr:primosomal protein N' [Methylophaga sp. 41_12_T18]
MNCILHIAIPCPLRQSFNYLATESEYPWTSGLRVKVSFGSREVIGIVLQASTTSDFDTTKLKPILERIDNYPLLDSELFNLITWVSYYYHHPIGDCFQTALPKKLRLGESTDLINEIFWKKEKTNTTESLGKKQQLLLEELTRSPEGLSQRDLKDLVGECKSSLQSLEKKLLVSQFSQPKQTLITTELTIGCLLNTEQKIAVDTVWKKREQFSPYLLQGITGSGKTEVYIQLCEKMLAEKKQVLILIPEIGLTPQFVQRFKQQLTAKIVVLNSSISATNRKQAWLLAKNSLADIIIGTRSAIFTPLTSAGLIILDEEHDASYKQQDGLRYHARNVALIRAQKLDIPIVLGSATPSLETLHHVNQQKYQRLSLTQRAGGAKLPKVNVIDCSDGNTQNGISHKLINAIRQHIENDNQVLLFINRRGFAPVLMCHDCNWQATCQSCDARMVVHQHRNILFCHHCGLIQRLPKDCPQCQAKELKNYGAGTEKVELTLQKIFPQTPVLRIDRDTTQRVNAFADMVAEIKQGGAKILVGTQMLAKGHDFHDVTLVGVLDADQGLYSADYRATESLAQLITQVTGRAGRGKKSGEVLIQTEQPRHDFWQSIIKQGYQFTADELLEQRVEMAMPPAGALCIIRAEERDQSLAMQFLTDVLMLCNQTAQQDVIIMGPVPAIMERKAGRYRAQLLFTTQNRRALHQLLDQHITAISALKLARKVRWSIDIDPIDLL